MYPGAERHDGRGSWGRWAGRWCAAGLVLAVAGCATGPKRSVVVQRTAHGVAHIQAPDLESAAYGVAYAHAQDNVCQTADHLLTVRGERSRFHGAEARGLLGLRSVSNEQSDFFIQLHMNDAALEKAWAQGASADAQALARGYVAGYNRFLADHAGQLPQACRNQPWVRPMTLADYRRVNELSMVQAGLAVFSDSILAAQAPAVRQGQAEVPGRRQTAADALLNASAVDAVLADARADARARGLIDPPIGSNGWAFGRQSTTDGRGVLLGNPHFPWVGVNRFWQMHVTVPGQLDVMGASIGVGPTPQIGFNQDVAWTHTVSTGKRFTIHELVLQSETPTAYLVDGQPEAMVPRNLSIQVRAADGQLGTRQATVWTSRYGPLLVIPRAGLTWNPRRAYAIQDANSGNVRALDAWLGFARAHSVADLRSSLATLGIPWVNTIATDRAGQAMYADVSVVPDITADQLRRCAPNPTMGQLFAAAGLPVLDGSRSDCNWRRDGTSPVPGLIPLARMPVLMRPDWVQNSNDSYWLSNPAIQLAGISPMVGPTGSPQRLRTRAALREIGQRLKPDTGAPEKVDIAAAQAMLLAHRNLAADLVLDDLLAACAAGPEKSAEPVRAGCDALRGWDRRNQLDSRGAHLFREWWRIAKDIPAVWRIDANPEDPVRSPAGLRMADGAVRGKVFDALSTAVQTVRSAGFALDAPLGTVQYRQLPRGPVGVPGGDEFEGVLDKMETQGSARLSAPGYAVNYGSSYVQAVGFDERGPVAEGLLVYGQSSDPASPFYFDALERLSGPRWPPLPFHAQDVAAARVGPVLRLLVP